MKDDLIIMGVLGVAVVGLFWYAKNAVGNGLSAIGDGIVATAPYIDPTDNRNVIYQAVSSPFGGSLGGYLYDLTH